MCSGLHYARPTAGVEPTPPSGPPRGAAGCLRRRLDSPRLAMALWPYPPCGSLAHLTAVRLKRLGGKAAHQQEPPSPLADSDPKLGLADSEPRVGHDSDRLTRILPGNSELRPDRDSDSLTRHPEG